MNKVMITVLQGTIAFTQKYESLEKELIQGCIHQETEVVFDIADVGRTTSSNGRS